MNSTPENATKFGIAASRKWWSSARELVVSFDRTTIEDAIVSWIELNQRDAIASTVPSIEFYYGLMNEAFLSLYDSQIINPIYPVTDLGQEFIDEARRATGIGAASLPTPEPPALTPAQKLEQEVKDDWAKLPSATIRKKIANNRQYREVFERISGGFESQATTHVVIQGA
jgi:hypothetical protein